MKLEVLQVSPIGTNCYLLCDEKSKRCAVIDPGGDGEKISATLAELGCTPSAILLTHGHYDHCAGVAELQALFPALAVYIHPGDVVDPSDRRAAQLFPTLGGDVRHYGEGDDVTVGQLTVHVLHTPGHSKGSVSLLVEDALFCGDTLFAGSCGRTDLLGGDGQEMLRSLRRLGQLTQDYKVYPGHMEASDLDCERDTNPYLRQALGT